MNEVITESEKKREKRSPLALPRVPFLASSHALDHAMAIRREVLTLMMRCVEGGPIVRLRVPAIEAHVVTHPDGMKHIFVDETKIYSKQTRGFAELRNVLGNGLLTSEGDFWLRQRRLMQPSFHKDPLGRFAGPIVASGERLAERWTGFARTRVPFDVSRELMTLTLEIVSATLMGVGVTDDDAKLVGASIETILEVVQKRLRWVMRPSIDVPLPAHRRLVRARDGVRALALTLIESRRRGELGHDLLSVLVNARDPETGESMSDEQLRDEVLTMVAAGHETTANALTWTFHLLASYPAAYAELVDELDRVLGGRSPTLDDLPKLLVTTNVLKESMRLYPPAWMIARLAERDDEMFGYLIPKGSHVFGSIYALHRNPEFWDHPLRFDPSRFSADREKSRPRLAYMPFGAGPHLCIGQPFAMLEGVLLLATLLQRVRLSPVDGQVVFPEPYITLRPRDGIVMTASVR